MKYKLHVDIARDVDSWFDTSEYPKDHQSGIKSGVNKKVIVMFKDKACGKQIQEFIGLRSKLYSFKLADDEHKKCKVVKKNVVRKSITHDDYKKCLFTREEQLRKMNVIRSHMHDIYNTEEVNKVTLSADDDKRIIMEDWISILAYGRYNSVITPYGTYND